MDSPQRSARRHTDLRKPKTIDLSHEEDAEVFEKSESKTSPVYLKNDAISLDLLPNLESRPSSRQSNRRSTESSIHAPSQRQKSFSRVITPSPSSPSPSEEQSKLVKLQMEHAFYSSKISVLTRRAFKQTMINSDLTDDLESTENKHVEEKAALDDVCIKLDAEIADKTVEIAKLKEKQKLDQEISSLKRSCELLKIKIENNTSRKNLQPDYSVFAKNLTSELDVIKNEIDSVKSELEMTILNHFQERIRGAKKITEIHTNNRFSEKHKSVSLLSLNKMLKLASDTHNRYNNHQNVILKGQLKSQQCKTHLTKLQQETNNINSKQNLLEQVIIDRKEMQSNETKLNAMRISKVRFLKEKLGKNRAAIRNDQSRMKNFTAKFIETQTKTLAEMNLMDRLLSGEVNSSKNVMEAEKRKLTPESSWDGGSLKGNPRRMVNGRRSLREQKPKYLMVTIKAQQTELELDNVKYELREEKVVQAGLQAVLNEVDHQTKIFLETKFFNSFSSFKKISDLQYELTKFNPASINGLLNTYGQQYATSHNTVTKMILNQFANIEYKYELQLAERQYILKTKQDNVLNELRKHLDMIPAN